MIQISLLDIDPPPKINFKAGSQRDICTFMFIALFTLAKRWKLPKCLLTGDWKNKMWYVQTMEYYQP